MTPGSYSCILEPTTYERDMDDYMARWSADLKTMEEEPASAAKDQRIQDHLANQAAVRQGSSSRTRRKSLRQHFVIQ